MGVRQKASELAAELKRTPDFAELKKAKAVIDGIPALKRELQDFNQKQNAIYSSRLPSSEVASRMEQLGKKYAELSKIPEINRYLRATKAFNDLVTSTMKDVSTSLEADLK